MSKKTSVYLDPYKRAKAAMQQAGGESFTNAGIGKRQEGKATIKSHTNKGTSKSPAKGASSPASKNSARQQKAPGPAPDAHTKAELVFGTEYQSKSNSQGSALPTMQDTGDKADKSEKQSDGGKGTASKNPFSFQSKLPVASGAEQGGKESQADDDVKTSATEKPVRKANEEKDETKATKSKQETQPAATPKVSDDAPAAITAAALELTDAEIFHGFESEDFGDPFALDEDAEGTIIQLIDGAKNLIFKLHDNNRLNKGVESYTYSMFNTDYIICPEVKVPSSHLGAKILWTNLKPKLYENDIPYLEPVAKLDVLQQDWVIYKDIGIRPLKELSKTGRYSNAVISQIASSLAHLHSIPMRNWDVPVDLFYEEQQLVKVVKTEEEEEQEEFNFDVDIQKVDIEKEEIKEEYETVVKKHTVNSSNIFSPQGFYEYYQDFLKGSSRRLAEGMRHIYTLFRYPECIDDWVLLPQEIKQIDRLSLCIVNFDPNRVFITDDGKVIIADWSCAGFAPGSFDVVDVMRKLRLNVKQAKIFIETYQKESGLNFSKLNKQLQMFNSVYTQKAAVEFLASAYRASKSEHMHNDDVEPVADALFNSISAAYKEWGMSDYYILPKESVLAAVRKWLRERGPTRSEWIPNTETLDEWLEKHMKIYHSDFGDYGI